MLSAAAFSLKISETYSRGSTLVFFVFGWFAIILWRLVLARFMVRALARGTFAEQKTILIADQGQLAGSSLVDEGKSTISASLAQLISHSGKRVIWSIVTCAPQAHSRVGAECEGRTS